MIGNKQHVIQVLASDRLSLAWSCLVTFCGRIHEIELRKHIESMEDVKAVVKPQVLQRAHHHLNHDTAEQSSSQQSIDSYVY